MPSREEIAFRVRLVNSGFNGRVHSLDPAVSDLVLGHPLFRDRYRATKFRENIEKWPGYVKTYTRAGADLDFYRWVHFIEGYNLGSIDRRLYTLAVPESNTISLVVYSSDPSPFIMEAVQVVT